MKENIKILSINDHEYPEILKEIPQAPKKLFYRGSLDALKIPNKLAVVGTRRCSNYGRRAAETITKDLARAGICIVSGLARGIDTFAHKSAMKYKTKTIAILGSGIDNKGIYPKINLRLAHDIIETGGLIMSEYEPGTASFPSNFPARNRIVAGLTQGTLVIEAPMQSGALITARLALDANRNVYAIPGSIFSYLNEGSHKLISQGAKSVHTSKDILEDFSIDYQEKKNSIISLDLNELERNVLNAIQDSNEAMHIDKIIQTTKLNESEVAEIVTSLILEDLIQEETPNTYVVCIR